MKTAVRIREFLLQYIPLPIYVRQKSYNLHGYGLFFIEINVIGYTFTPKIKNLKNIIYMSIQGIVCPELKTPINGHEPNCQYKSSYDRTPYYGTVCSFTCNTGYMISNSTLLACTDGGYTRGGVGVWNHKEPTCDGLYTRLIKVYFYTKHDAFVYMGYSVHQCMLQTALKMLKTFGNHKYQKVNS